MDAVKHTPGPWAVTGISQDTGSISVGQRDLRIVICDVTNAASFGDFLAGAMKRGGGSFEQSDARTQFANARLIAAAPDMLAALTRLLVNIDTSIASGAVVDSCHQARAAIAKATGEAK